MREAAYQSKLIKKLERKFPGCFVLKNDPQDWQGLPDLLILFENMWGMLEVKMADDSEQQPNQEYYVALFNGMSFAAFINPDNEDEVLDALQQSFGFARSARIS